MKKLLYILIILLNCETTVFGYSWSVLNSSDEAFLDVILCTAATGINKCAGAFSIPKGWGINFDFGKVGNDPFESMIITKHDTSTTGVSGGILKYYNAADITKQTGGAGFFGGNITIKGNSTTGYSFSN